MDNIEETYRGLLGDLLEECCEGYGPCDLCGGLVGCDTIYKRMVCEPEIFTDDDYELGFVILLLILPLFVRKEPNMQ